MVVMTSTSFHEKA